MTGFIESLSIDQDWLLTANLLLSSLLLLWVVRYRILYRKTKNVAHMHSASIEGIGVGFYRAKLDGTIVNANPALVNMGNYESEDEFLKYINSEPGKWYVDPKRAEEFRTQLTSQGEVTEFVSQIRCPKSGELAWITESAHLVATEDHTRPTHYEGSVQDITDTVNRSKLEERLERLSENLPGGLFQLRRDGSGKFSIEYASKGLRALLGLGNEQFAEPERYIHKITPDFRSNYRNSLEQSFQRNSNWECEFKINTGQGMERWMGLNATPQKFEDGSVVWHGHVNDISDRKTAEGKIAYYAYYDTLTGLPNRSCFMYHLDRTLASYKRRKDFGAVLFIDLDNFKQLNDTEGHAKGDELLQQVARRLEKCVRANDMVSRFGGDEFVVLLDAIGDNKNCAQNNSAVVSKKILRSFAPVFPMADDVFKTSPSIGVTIFDGSNENSQTLIKEADTAMYEAKKNGRNNFQLFVSDKAPAIAPAIEDLALEQPAGTEKNKSGDDLRKSA